MMRLSKLFRRSVAESDYSSTEESLFDSPQSSPTLASFEVESLGTSGKRPTSCYVTPPLPSGDFSVTRSSLISSVQRRKSTKSTRSISTKSTKSTKSNLSTSTKNTSIHTTFQKEPTTPKINVNFFQKEPTTPKPRSSPKKDTTPKRYSSYEFRKTSFENERNARYSTADLDNFDIPARSPLRPKSPSRPNSTIRWSRLPQMPEVVENESHQSIDKVMKRNHRTSTYPPVENKSVGHKVSYTIPKLNLAENILKLKIYIGDRNEDAVALKLRKDKLNDVNELIDVIIYKIIDRTNTRAEDVKISIFFKTPGLNSIVLKGDDDSADFGMLHKDLLLDYIMAKNKLYIRASY